MKRLLLLAACCSMALSGAEDLSAQTVSKIGAILRIELTNDNDTCVVDRINIGFGRNVNTFIRVTNNGTVIGVELAYDVNEIYLDAKGGHDDVTIGSGFEDVYLRAFGRSGNDTIDCGSCNGAAVFGDSGDDVIFGTEEPDWVSAGSGNDIVYGLAGNDWLNGQDGRDTTYGGDGNDVIRPGYGGREGTTHGGRGADEFWIDDHHGIYRWPSDFNWFEGDRLFQI